MPPPGRRRPAPPPSPGLGRGGRGECLRLGLSRRQALRSPLPEPARDREGGCWGRAAPAWSAAAALTNGYVRPSGSGEERGPSLRSLGESLGRLVAAGRGRKARVQDLLVDDRSLVVRWLVASLEGGRERERVLLSPATLLRVPRRGGIASA